MLESVSSDLLQLFSGCGKLSPMTDLEAKLAALTCLWCSKGIPVKTDSWNDAPYHSLSGSGGDAPCTSKHREIKALFEREQAEALSRLDEAFEAADATIKEYFARPEVKASFKDWWKRGVQ